MEPAIETPASPIADPSQLNPAESISTEQELSAWRRYQASRVGHPDLLGLIGAGLVPDIKASSSSNDSGAIDIRQAIKGDPIVANIKERFKERLTHCTVGHQILVSVNPADMPAKRAERDKELLKTVPNNHASTRPGAVAEDVEDDNFLLLSESDRQMLISDPRANHIIQEHSHAHIFTFASRAYFHMIRQSEDQIVFFRGETGSGKSTSSKMFMVQLFQLSNTYARTVAQPLESGRVERADYRIVKKVMASLQLIDLFSTAQTPLNPSASRMHKYIELQFDRHGKLAGAKIVDLMLEKLRVTQSSRQSRYDRNFQIFYDLFLAGQLSKEERDSMHFLESAKSYRFLEPNSKAFTRSYKKIFDQNSRGPPTSIKKVLFTLGFGANTQTEIIKILNAILLLGNLDFAVYEARKEEGAYVTNTSILEKIAILLGVAPEALETTLTQKTAYVGATLCVDFLSLDEASAARDQLAITLYGMLFEYLMRHINDKMNSDLHTKPGSGKWENWISLFDFAGFENTSVISSDPHGTSHQFWQFMVNICDDRVHGWCHQWIFEQSRVLRPNNENVSENASAVMKIIMDSQLALREYLALFQHPVKGLLPILDEETARFKTDEKTKETSLAELYARAQNAKAKRATLMPFSEFRRGVDEDHFIPGHSKSVFGIRHYAGENLSEAVLPPNSLKTYYDTSDFVFSNSLGGRGTISAGVKTDFVRLVKGSADFTSSKNKFLVSIVDSQVEIGVHPDSKDTIISAVIPETPSAEGKIAPSPRRPTLKPDNDEIKLSTMVVDSLHSPLFKQMMHSKHESEVFRNAALTSTSFGAVSPGGAAEKPKAIVSTRAAEFFSDLTDLMEVLNDSGNIRFWHVLCLRPNDELTSKKINEDRLYDQIRRLSLPLIVLDQVGGYSESYTWRQFLSRYGELSADRATGDEPKKLKRHSRLMSSSLNPDQVNEMKQQCREIYEMFGIITGGGSGKVVASDERLYLNERSWWALERNLLAIEIQEKMRHYDKFIEEPVETEEVESVVLSEVVAEDDSKNWLSNQDPDIRERERRMRAMERSKLSSQRIHWLRITKFLTWWIPTSLLIKIGHMKSKDVIQAWREKVALFILIMLTTGLMLFLIVGFGPLICPRQNVMTFADMQVRREKETLVGANGGVYELSKLIPQHPVSLASSIGKDASAMFPLGNVADNLCSGFTADATAGTPPVAGTCAVNGIDFTCCHPNIEFPTKMKEVKNFMIYMGQLAFTDEYVSTYSSATDFVVIVDGSVYKISKTDTTLGDDLAILRSGAGQDISNQKNALRASGALQLMENGMYIGVLDRRKSVKCLVAANTLLALTIIICSVMLVKFLAALQLGARREPEDHLRYCILQIPCYTEGEESLKKTINTCAMLDYDDDKKLLFLIADGLIKGNGNSMMTPALVLEILGIENSEELLTRDDFVPRYDYIALGDGMARHNKAKVFSGFYSYMTHRVPFIVVVKCGKESEIRRPGNRGKRDSQLILMKFLNKVYFDRPMMPLELEIARHMRERIKIDPINYEYCLMVDADTEVVEDSLKRLIAVFIHDSKVMGLCGETTIGNEDDSWVTMIQVYEYYISHHLAKAFESLFGSVTCLPGCFCMYRVRSPGRKPIPLLIDDAIIHEYEENQVDTLHKKNLLSLGEDRYLTTLMLKQFPGFRNKFTPDAKCKTIVPDQFMVLLSQRRRWINSTVHNLWELLLVPQLCGCLCFSMRFVVFLDLFGTLTMPGTIGYLGYLIYRASTSEDLTQIVMSIYLFAAVYGCQAIIFLLRRKWDMIMWMLIYMLSLPVYGLALPLYSYWHFDDFSWGNTRLVTGDSKGGHGGDSTEEFDEKTIVLRRYDGEKKQLSDVSRDVYSRSGSKPPTSSVSGSQMQLLDEDVLKTAAFESGNSHRFTATPGENQTRLSSAFPNPYVAPVIAPYDNASVISSSQGYNFNPYAAQYAVPVASYPVLPYPYVQRPSSQFSGLYNQPMRAVSRGGLGTPGMKLDTDFVAAGQLPPLSPFSPVLPTDFPSDGDMAGALRVETGGEIKQDGLPISLYPLPPGIPIFFGRVLFKEIVSVVESQDLHTLTKKKVRDMLNVNLNAEKKRWEAGGSQTAIYDDLKMVFTHKTPIDLNDAQVRGWVNQVITYALAHIQ